MEFFIKDWYKIHSGYQLDLSPGYTALVGPNGAGKSTLLNQLAEHAQHDGISIFRYSNLSDGGYTARQGYLEHDQPELLATVLTSSEGEQIAVNFSQAVSKIGAAVRQAALERQPLLILLDALDSGASVDRIRELRHLFEVIMDDPARHDIYIVAAANSYEMSKQTDAVDVRTGKHLRFDNYDDYADFICKYFSRHKKQTKR